MKNKVNCKKGMISRYKPTKRVCELTGVGLRRINKKAQEEMIGFALIIIIVAVILLMFLGFSLRSTPETTIENYEVDSFIQGFLQHTTDCRDNLEFMTIQKLIFDCVSNEVCLDGRSTCEVLKNTLSEITEESWKIQDTRVKGYMLNITSDNNEKVLVLEKGNKTRNFKGSSQDFSKGGNSVKIVFIAYS
ncbi:MAG: hypothetical protein ACE5ES_00790 [Candidatus Nanoarchaeia archaeon]